MNRFKNQNIIITGGSAGIGFATAREFARLKGNLFLIARNMDQLEEAKSALIKEFPDVQVEIFSADVADQQRIMKVVNEIGNSFGGIHTVINNAGTSGHGRMADQDIESLKQIMDVNYFGALYTIRAAWPFLLKSEKGHIGFVSSVAGYIGLIGYCAYTPTKFALSGLAECLRMEAKEKGIGVTIVYPPDTQTDMLERERKVALPETIALSKRAKILQPEQVAASFVKGIRKNQFEVYCNVESVWIRRLRILLPRVYFKQLDRIAIGAS